MTNKEDLLDIKRQCDAEYRLRHPRYPSNYDESKLDGLMKRFQIENAKGGYLRSFAHQWTGVPAVVAVAKEVMTSGRRHEIIVTDHPVHNPENHTDLVGLLVLWREKNTIRYVDNMIAGESKLCDADPVEIAATLMDRINFIFRTHGSTSLCAFRQP